MWPSLLVLGVGRRRRVPLPLPLFLAWPAVGAGWAVIGLAALVAPGSTRRPGALGTLRTGLTVFNQIRGTRIDVDDSKGTHIHLRLV